jgi:hypothetical protein
MLGWIRVKMVIQESALGDDMFFGLGSTIVGNGNGASACNDPCTLGRDYSTNQLGSWGPTFSRFSSHNVECKKGEE